MGGVGGTSSAGGAGSPRLRTPGASGSASRRASGECPSAGRRENFGSSGDAHAVGVGSGMEEYAHGMVLVSRSRTEQEARHEIRRTLSREAEHRGVTTTTRKEEPHQGVNQRKNRRKDIEIIQPSQIQQLTRGAAPKPRSVTKLHGRGFSILFSLRNETNWQLHVL